VSQKIGRDIEVHIAGSVTGQVAVGDHNVQVTAGPGAVVTVLGPGERPVPRLRLSPIRRLPRPFPGLLGREPELVRAREGLVQGGPLDLHGPPGMGKTALLRHLCHSPSLAPEEVAYALVAGLPLEDVLQSLFELCYEADVPLKPGHGDLRHLLADIRMLFVLDDVTLGREEAEALAGFAPGASFALASEERKIWGEGVALTLGGIPMDAGVELFERELGRSLTQDERADAQRICEGLGGHPLGILQAAAGVREEGRSVREVALALGAGRVAAAPADDGERRVLAALGSLGGAALPGEVLGAATGLEDPTSPLDRLASIGMVIEDVAGYRSAGPVEEPDTGVGERLAAGVEADPAQARALARAPAALLLLLQQARAAGLERTAIRLARAVEGTLTLDARWGVWRLVLDEAVLAAAGCGDRREEGWALHQLGSRALCLGEREEARSILERALDIREEAGDQAGVAVTRHNLEQLGPAGPPEVSEHGTRPDPPRWGRRLLVGGAIATGLIGGAVGAQQLLDREPRVETSEVETEASPLASPEDPDNGGGGTPTLIPRTELLGFKGTALGRRSEPMAASFSNTGDATITISDVAIQGDDFVEAGGTCRGVILEPGASCQVEVVFFPLEGGDRQATLILRGGGLEAQVPLHGVGLIAKLEVNPLERDFGSRFLGDTSETQHVVVSNVGEAVSRVIDTFVDGDMAGDWDIITDACIGTDLSPDETCAIEVAFQPSDVGDRTSTLVIQHDASGDEARVTLIGWGYTVD
jgi:HYDIN/CFA65/VesB-like, Ig-like domain